MNNDAHRAPILLRPRCFEGAASAYANTVNRIKGPRAMRWRKSAKRAGARRLQNETGRKIYAKRASARTISSDAQV